MKLNIQFLYKNEWVPVGIVRTEKGECVICEHPEFIRICKEPLVYAYFTDLMMDVGHENKEFFGKMLQALMYSGYTMKLD